MDLQMVKKCRLKMLIKINILSIIFSQHFVLILIDVVRTDQNYGHSNGQEMLTKNVNKNKYFEYHF